MYCPDEDAELRSDEGIRGPIPFGRPMITSELVMISSPGEIGIAALISVLWLLMSGEVVGFRAMAASTLCRCSCSLIQCPDGGGGTTKALGVFGSPSEMVPPTGM